MGKGLVFYATIYIYIYIYIYYNMKVDIACILKINIYIPIKKFTQNKYSKKNVLL